MRLLNGLSQDLEAPGERPGRGWVPRRRGGSQNNGIPCVWSPSSTVHIFHESRRGEERVRGWVSPAPAQTLGQPSAWSPQSAGHSRASGALLSSWLLRRCPVALEAGRDATEPARQPDPARTTGAHLRFAQHPPASCLAYPEGLWEPGNQQGCPRSGQGCCAKPSTTAPQSRSAPTYSYFTHSTHKAGLCGPSPRQTRSSSCGGGSPGVT